MRSLIPLIVALAVVGCAAPIQIPTGPPTVAPTATAVVTTPPITPSPSPTHRPTPTPDPLEAQVDQLVASMSAEEKVGQLVLGGLAGRSGTVAARELVGRLRLGGLILFAPDVGTPRQVRELTDTLQGAADVPLLVAVDHEGGRIDRFDPPVTQFPAARILGRTGDPDLARAAGEAAGSELLAMGVNVDLAPVLDVVDVAGNQVIGDRSFGDEPALVAQMGTAFADGLAEAGVVAVGKHFPGHGHTAVDSHVELPVVDRSRVQLERIDLRPFAAAIDDGIPALMTAHVLYTALDPERPATLSSAIIGRLLRRDLGFEGVVVTDALEMGAISDRLGRGEAAVLAVLAGADVVLVSDRPDMAIAALSDAVAEHRLGLRRLDASVRRILRLKLTHADGWADQPPLSVVGSAQHAALLEEIVARAEAASP